MALTNGNTLENNNFKFLELRKYLVWNENNGMSCVAVDNTCAHVLVANENNITVLSVDHLLDFTWNKSIINEFIDQFENYSFGTTSHIHFVSISAKGFGTKLAVCQRSPNTHNDSPFIEFFHINSIYKNKSNSTHYSRINLINSYGFVSDMCWHPEMCDHYFACCVTDGSVFIVSIGDMDSKTASILAYLPANHNLLSLCWSPKGKQIVISYKNGFSQFKLINGKQLQECKKTLLPNEFHDYSVVAIKWIVSSLFAIACCKPNDNEKDSHIMLVSTPAKSAAKYVDFGSVCLDNIEAEGVYRVYLMHYENILLCSTSFSTEISIIGCNGDDISSPDNWSQWLLDDNSRIDLPLDRDGNESYLRGFAIARGIEQTFRLSNTEVYGGVKCPILITYLSSGIVLPYLMIQKVGDIKIPEVPNIVRPVLTNQSKSANISTTQMDNSVDILVTQPSNLSLSSSFAPVVSTLSVPPKAITNTTRKQSSIASSIDKNEVQQHNSFKALSDPEVSPMKTTHLANTKQNQIDNKKEITDAETQNTKDLYLDAINDQINEFNKTFTVMKEKFFKIKAKIGEKDEQTKLRMDTRLIEEVLVELQENFKSFSRDITILQSSVIESFSLIEEAKSIMDRNVDPKYRYLLRQRALDPITARRMEEIKKINQYIEMQLRELDAKLEQEWLEWLEKRKLFKSNQLFSNKHSFSNWELVYKALANNQRVIANLRSHLERSQSLLPKNVNTLKSPENKAQNKYEIENLSQTLKKSCLKENELFTNDPVFKIKVISKEKKSRLKEFLENRPNVPIRRTVDYENNSASRFISAIEKIKEKSRKQNLSTNKSDINYSHDNKKLNEANSPKIHTTVSQLTKSESGDRLITTQKTISKLDKPLTLPIQKLDQKLPPPLFTSTTKANEAVFLSTSTASSDSIQVMPKSIPFSITSDSPSNKLSPKSSPPASIVKAKPVSETHKIDQTIAESIITPISSTAAKTVSFGNTTIINPTKALTDNSLYKGNLATISECTENTETVSTTSSSFSAFAAKNDKQMPALSFNLNISNSANLFPKKDDILSSTPESKIKNSPPKYEDISPPTTPQNAVSEAYNQSKEIIATSISPNLTKSQSILKTTLSESLPRFSSESKPIKNNEINDKSSVPEIIELTKSISDSKVTSTTTSTTSTKAEEPKATAPDKSIQSPLTLTTTSSVVTPVSPIVSSSSTSSFGFESTNEKQDQSLFANQKVNATPFSANSFSFGNVNSPNDGTSKPSFGQTLPFGGNFSFNQSTPASNLTNTATNSLSFGQQSDQAALSNLSFCGLGGQPSAENANKNVFGNSISTPTSQSTSLFKSTNSPQALPFSGQSSPSGGFGGNFSSGSQAGVAQTGFGSFQQSSQQTSTPVFGGSAVFGAQQPSFGSSVAFANSSPPAFGSGPTFGGSPIFGSSATFASQQQPNTFGSGFSNQMNNSLSFGALASSAQQPKQNTSPFSSSYNSPQTVFGSNNQSQGFAFGGSGASGSASFTQRRK